MAELTTPAETTANSCCSTEAQATCCEPSAKAACCDPSHGDGCDCSAGKGAEEAPASDIREQVRERYAAAAVQVTTTDPGAGCCAPSETFDGGSEVFGAALYALASGDPPYAIVNDRMANYPYQAPQGRGSLILEST